MEPDLLTPAVSAVGGGLTVGWIAKVMIQNWIRRNEQSHEQNSKSIHEIQIALTRIEEQTRGMSRIEDQVRSQDKSVAVMESQLKKLIDDLNAIGQKLRQVV